jgi:hypothetical protein
LGLLSPFLNSALSCTVCIVCEFGDGDVHFVYTITSSLNKIQGGGKPFFIIFWLISIPSINFQDFLFCLVADVFFSVVFTILKDIFTEFVP